MSLIASWTYPPSHLESLKWQNRVLLLFAPTSTDGQLDQQLNYLRPNQRELEDRDLLVYSVGAGNPLGEKFKVESTGFTVILIGKDGTEKLRKHKAVPAKEILRLIDSMPMRRAGGR